MTALFRFARRSLLAGTGALGVLTLGACGSSNEPAASAEARSFASVEEWAAREAIELSSDKDFATAVDRVMASLGDQVAVLGFGEPLHGGEEFLTLRNRVFQRLVAAHRYSAITLEIPDARARIVNDYIAGRGPATYEEIQESGFSYGAGLYAANRELVEWMKQYNADPAHTVKLSFHGTLPTEQGESTESPRRALELVFTYLQSVDPAAADRHRKIIEPLVGTDAEWEGASAGLQREIMARLLGGADAQKDEPAADPALEFAISPRARALRLAVETLADELQMLRPELVARSDRASFQDALHDLAAARNVLAIQAALARREPLGHIVSMRDAMAADHLVYISEREQARGKVMVHLHNTHLRRTRTKLPWYEFLPTGAHLDLLFGERFAVIGGAVGQSDANFIAAPEAGSLEAMLLKQQSDFFLPTWRGRRLPEDALKALPVRSGAQRPFVPYEPLSERGVAELDAILFLRSATQTRGMPAWPG